MSGKFHKILGVPGTGKTTRCRGIFEESILSGIPIEDHMYVTYRKEAVAAEKVKLSALTGLDISELGNVRTMHGMSLSLLMQNKIIRPKNRRIPVMQKWDYAKFNRDCGYNVNPERMASEDVFAPINDPRLAFYAILMSTRTPLKSAGNLPMDFTKIPLSELQRFVEDYNNWKMKNGKIDFPEMVDLVLDAKLSPECSVQIYDECQDMTTQLHDEMQLWARNADRVVLAGDPLQTLYPYAGADPAYFTEQEGELEILPFSRRLAPNIWQLASGVISTYTPYSTPSIKTKPENGWIYPVNNSKLVNFLLSTPKNPNSSVFHLVRTSITGYSVAQKLYKSGIPFVGLPAFAWSESEMNLYNAIRGIQLFKSVTANELIAIMEAFPEKYVCLPTGKKEFIGELTKGRVKAPLLQYIKTDLLDAIRSNNPLGLCDVSKTSLMKLHGALDRKIIRIEATAGTGQPIPGYAYLDQVQLLTIHGSKGLEADTVFLHTEITKATKNAILTKKGLENEAYVWYVGITRAIKNLICVNYPGNEFYIPGVCV
jgi:DNA helicase II / ATP-dependent DNA helicase PcrA